MTPDQRREMTRLMASADVAPLVTPIRSGEAELARITGAQTPSGVPVVIAAPVVERPRRAASGAGSSSRGRRSRPSQGRGGGQGAGTAQPRTGQGRAGQGRPTGESPRRRPRRQSTGGSAGSTGSAA
ncbi:DEAD/DEAH box helicase [Streptomyces violaceorubidus]